MSQPASRDLPVEPVATATWIERLARIGYAAKGLVYIVIGLLAVRAAVGAGGETTGSEGALRHVLGQPFGKLLLALVALGLAGYVVWRLVQAVKNPEGHGHDMAGWFHRGFALASAVVYTGILFGAIRLLAGNGGGGDQTEDRTAQLMVQPGGRWLVALVGLVVLAIAGWQPWRAWSGAWRKRLRLEGLSAMQARSVERTARLGLVSRGVVFAVIGAFFVVAAWRADPQEAKGLGEALSTLERQSFGPWLLGLVALGLAAYGVYQLVEARYRSIHP